MANRMDFTANTRRAVRATHKQQASQSTITSAELAERRRMKARRAEVMERIERELDAVEYGVYRFLN